MITTTQPVSMQTVFNAIKQQLACAEFSQAAHLLTIHIEQLLYEHNHQALIPLLNTFPVEQFDADPNLLRARGLVYLAAEDLDKAATLLHRASLLYLQNHNLAQTVDCYCHLVNIYQRRENFSTAYLYVQEAERLLPQVTELAVKATLMLRLAELCPDIGRLQEGIAYAKAALDYFRTMGAIAEQFKALLLLAIIYRQLGSYQEAAARLEMAEQVSHAGRLGIGATAALLSAAAHLHWYQGRWAAAISKAEAFHQFTRQHKLIKQQIYSVTLLGNLQRVVGQWAAATAHYHEARTLVEQFNFHLYRPWVDVQEGWLQVLIGDYSSARRLLHKALEQADHGQMMSFNVNLALLNILTGRFYTARDLLQVSLTFYGQSGDELATTVIQLYLGLIELKTNALTAATPLLHSALGWFDARHLTYFPHWWHPQLVGEVCIFALLNHLYPLLAERILIQQIGPTAVDLLYPLRNHAEAAMRERVEILLECFHEQIAISLEHVKDAPVKQIIGELLQQGWLRRDGFSRLQMKLQTAHHQQRANPVLLAVFALYLHDYSQTEIATRLGRAEASVRNYITTLYQIFDLPQSAFPSQTERKRALKSMAIEQGFIQKSE